MEHCRARYPLGVIGIVSFVSMIPMVIFFGPINLEPLELMLHSASLLTATIMYMSWGVSQLHYLVKPVLGAMMDSSGNTIKMVERYGHTNLEYPKRIGWLQQL